MKHRSICSKNETALKKELVDEKNQERMLRNCIEEKDAELKNAKARKKKIPRKHCPVA